MTVKDLIAAGLRTAAEPNDRVLACIGVDVPRELVLAAGLTPWRMTPDEAAVVGDYPGLSSRSNSLLRQIGDAERAPAGVAIAHGTAEDAQLFAVLRELVRTGRGPICPLAFVDLLHQPGAATTTYNLARLRQFADWLGQTTGQAITSAGLADAVQEANATKQRLARVFAARTAARPTLSGCEALDLITLVSRLPQSEADALISSVETALASAKALAGKRVFVTGSPHETSALYRAIEQTGCVIVGEDHIWGDPWVASLLDETLDPMDAISARAQARTVATPTQSSALRASAVADRAQTLRVDAVIHCSLFGDEASPWDIKATREALAATATPFLTIAVRDASDEALDAAGKLVADFLAGTITVTNPVRSAKTAPAPTGNTGSTTKPIERRSRKSLACTAEFGAWQRAWFAEVQQRAATGPFAVVNADTPQEILRAMDIPYVVNQWWASIVAAKQKARDYGRLLREHDYPSHIESYSAQGLAAALDDDDASAPWGGLPDPNVLALVANSDPGPKIYQAWTQETGADLFVYERSIDGRLELPLDWWDDLPERWAQTLEPERLALMSAQIEEQISQLETLTGRTLDRQRLVEVMNLVNEQEDFYRRTRDLIARSYPVPVSVVDTMPATMVPQWHRGTVWARDAARRLFEEVSDRVAAGEAACPDERVRLMWVGRGLWSNTGFYQQWEESHGAVFVWSMYLGLAADGYLRAFEGEHDVVQALAARFVTMGDELRMPTWSGAWHVKEARLHGCHGAVAIDDADPLVLDALERAGIPVCRVAMNNMSAGDATAEAAITAFIEGLTP